MVTEFFKTSFQNILFNSHHNKMSRNPNDSICLKFYFAKQFQAISSLLVLHLLVLHLLL